MVQPSIKIDNVSFTYPDGTVALAGVSLEVEKGQFVAIMGPNGAGKSTLCLLLNGIIPNVVTGTISGTVSIAGSVVSQQVWKNAQRVGMVLQDPEAQLLSPDVRMECAFGPENLGVEPPEIERRIAWALNAVGMDGLSDRSPKDLSGGQKQRLALAACLTMLPEVLVLDEPTSQLDPVGTDEVFAVVNDLRRNHNITVVMAEHKSEEVAQFADQVVVLDKGRIVAKGPTHDVFGRIPLLRKIGVKVPPVTEAASELRFDTNPITLSEGKESFVKLLKAHVLQVHEQTTNRIENSNDCDGEIVLEARALTHEYASQPPFTALKDVNLAIRRGEFVAVVGQNGAGKTTLVKHFVGQLKATNGQVLFEGRDVGAFKVVDLAPRIGLVLQNPDHQLFAMSAGEEVAFGLRNIGTPEGEIDAKVNEALRLVGLQEKKSHFPFRLSFGDRRKLTVAAVVAMRPTVLILDEPTTGQDFLGRVDIAEIAKRLNHEFNTTIIMITHDMDLVAKYARRTIAMGKGRVLLDGPTAVVFGESVILGETNVRPPQITRLGQEISSYGVPRGILTVDEFCRIVRR